MSVSDAASAGGGQTAGNSGSNASEVTQPHTAHMAPPGSARPAPEDQLATERPAWTEAELRGEALNSDPGNGYVTAPTYASVGASGSLGPGSGMGAYPAGVHAAGAGSTAPPPLNASARTAAVRRARLKVAHLGPVSVLRISLTFSLCMFIVLLVAVAALWAVLDASGVFRSIVDAATTLTSDKNSVGQWLSFGRVMLITIVLGVANVIAFTLLSTIGALLYNLCSDFVGGVEVTLTER